MIVYHKPNAYYQAETLFVEALQLQFRKAEWREESYPIAENYLEKYVHTPSLIAALEQDQKLPVKKRENCLEILKGCPDYLKVTHYPRFISFDIVIKSDDETYYWEFRENQHRKLTVNKERKIYNADNGEPITVPRYLQRFVRDVWRLQYFRPYTIVWKDWFTANQIIYQPKIQSGLQEYVLPSEFSFLKFYELYNNSLSTGQK